MITSEQIIEARSRVGETQTRFAERFGVNQSTIHRWEAEGPPTSGPALKMLEQVVGQIASEEADDKSVG